MKENPVLNRIFLFFLLIFCIFSCIFQKKFVFLQKVRYLTNEHNKKHKS